MPTIRSSKQRGNFVVISKELVCDNRLAAESRWAMIYLIGKPDDWVVRLHDLMRQGRFGKHKATRILRELVQYGYLKRRRIHQPDGTFVWETVVVEQPALGEPTIDRLSIDGSSVD
ncbi:MAG TPA: hypothetical protein VMJ64_06765, partial [Anaerolineales bacterium]|nr:hypothetical protein [Anaerolineales bacterium]